MQRRRDILISILEDIRAIYPCELKHTYVHICYVIIHVSELLRTNTYVTCLACRLWFSALSFSVRSVMITLPQEGKGEVDL